MAISNPRKLVYIYSETFGLEADHYWVELPTPSDYQGSSSTLVDSARNDAGQVVGSVIASDIAKIELKWNFLTVEQYKNIARLFEPKYGGSFYVPVSFFDVITGLFEGKLTKAPNDTDNVCRLFYCGDRKVAFAHIKLDSNGYPIGYQNVQLNLIDTGIKQGEDLCV